MAYEFLKALFGEPKEGEEPKAMTFAELEQAINADKNIKVVDLSSGDYVSKSKFDSRGTELEGVKQQLETDNATINSFKDQDIEGIKKSVSDWETKYNKDTQKLKDQLAAEQRAHAEEMFMTGYHFTSKPAREGVLNAFKEQNFQMKDGKFVGADEYMQKLMENDDYKGAFAIEKEPEADPEVKPETPPMPRFAAGTTGIEQTSENPFLKAGFGAGFTRIRQPKKN